MLLVYLASQTLFDDRPDDEIAYSEAKAIAEDRPTTVENASSSRARRSSRWSSPTAASLEARYPSDLSALEFERALDEQGIRHESRAGGGGTAWFSILAYLLPFVLFMGFWVYLMSRHQGKAADRRRGESEADHRGEADDPGRYPDPYR